MPTEEAFPAGQPLLTPPSSKAAQQAAAQAARGFGNLQCQECADCIQQALRAAGHRGQLLELRGGGHRGFLVSKSLPPNAPAVSQNGRHVGVRVGEVVFDNLHPDGIPYDEWLEDFDAIGGIRIHSVQEF